MLAVEPDNARATGISATPAGVKAFETSSRFFAGAGRRARRDITDAAVGPRLPALFARHGIEPLERPPVSRLAVPPGRAAAEVWTRRREAVRAGDPAGADRHRPRPRPRVSRRARRLCRRSRDGRPRLRRNPEHDALCDRWPENVAKATRAGTSTRPFYDWENARTLGRRDVPFWRTVAAGAGGTTLELGCGTGRIAMPLGRAGVSLVGIDRSDAMLARARRRVARARLNGRVSLVRGDIRALPFPAVDVFAGDRAVRRAAVAASRARSRLPRCAPCMASSVAGGTFGVELVADLPSWDEYKKRVSLKGWKNRRGGAARHAGRDRAAGSRQAPHDLRPGVHRTDGPSPAYAPLRADFPDALRATDGPSSREGGL